MYETVFELSNRWPEIGLHSLIALILVAVASILVKPLRRSPTEYRLVYAAAIGIPLLAALFVGLTTLITVGDFVRLDGASRRGQAAIVEGPVMDFVEGRTRTKTWESFSVDGVEFSYAESLLTAGFNHTFENGGPISGDERVRITHVAGTIIKLEVHQ